MKILMLGWELPPHHSGGLGVACYQLCKTLAYNGVNIEFVVPYTAEHNIDFMRVHAAHPQSVVTVKKSGIAYDSYRYVYPDGTEESIDMFGQQDLYERSVERLVDELEFDVIHAHDWLTFRAALRAKERSGCPLILHVHALESDRAASAGKGNPLIREIEETALHLGDKIVAVSQYTKDAMVREYGVPPEKISVVHNSIDLSGVVPLDDSNGYTYLVKMKAQGYKVVVNIGRQTMQKNLPNLLHAAQAVIAREPKTLFMLAGKGEQYHELVELAAQLGISKNVIVVNSFLPNRKFWRDAFAIGDLFVMPSVSEPFGITALEAIGYGTPVLISRQSGVAEVLKNALKVDFWDINQMANQITAVVQNSGLGEELLNQSSKEYDNMSWQASIEKLVGLYHEQTMGVLV